MTDIEDEFEENANPAPAEEPSGYISAPGFVKSRWENNEHYLEQFDDSPWYPILKRTHEAIKELVPQYNIGQIKEKFGGLRYYYDLPAEIPLGEGYYNTEERVRTRVAELVRYAEAWVDGYEYAHKEKGKV